MLIFIKDLDRWRALYTGKYLPVLFLRSLSVANLRLNEFKTIFKLLLC